MVSCELGKEIEKDVFSLVESVGLRKKFGLPTRNRTSDLSHKDSITKTRVRHTVRISNVDSVMLINRIRQMVSFQLGKGFFSLSHAGDMTKNIFI